MAIKQLAIVMIGQMIDDDPADSHSGNFHALLQFHIDAGDCVLKEYLQMASKNAIYTSKTLQNDMIKACGRIKF